jgi:hypothetical protein
MDEDVSEREVRPLFERSLKKIEEMALKGIPFLLFQPNGFSENPPFTKGGVGGLMSSRRAYLMRRLFQFSNEVWRISLEDEEPRVVLEKGLTKSQIADSRLKNPCLDDSVIPVLARRSASARRRVNGNIDMNIIKKYGFLLLQE